MSDELQEIMQALHATDGLQCAWLFDHAGNPLASTPSTTHPQQRAAAIGMGAIHHLGTQMHQDNVKRAVLELGSLRMLYSTLTDNATLCVLTDDSFNMGLLVNAATQWEQQLRNAIESEERGTTDV